MIFGTPTGTACIAVVPMVVPAEPPSEMIPSISPAACFSATSAAAPCAIIVTLFPRSPSSLSACKDEPAACATSSAEISGVNCGSPNIPVLITHVETPLDSICALINENSMPFVSIVPTMHIVFAIPGFLHCFIDILWKRDITQNGQIRQL